MIPLDIISDPICPWCYIGKVKFDRAIAEMGENPFDITWRMFRLNPEMPAEGMGRKAYLEAKFGGPEGAARVYGSIEKAAKDAGLAVRFDRIERTPQTLDAHRLIRWAQTTGDQGAVVDRLFDAYFLEGQTLSDPTFLAGVAEAVGMDGSVVARLLEGEADRAELEAEEAEARRMGVSGVPCFIINGRYVLQGAQETETWVRIIRELQASMAAARPAAEGA